MMSLSKNFKSLLSLTTLVLYFCFFSAGSAWTEEYQTIQITDNVYLDDFPKIHNGEVVWLGYHTPVTADYDVFLYRNEQIIPITNDITCFCHDYSASIHNGQVVWQRGSSGCWDFSGIFLYKDNQTTQLIQSSSQVQDITPKIHDGQVAWVQSPVGSYQQIFLYNGTYTSQLSFDNSWKFSPQIHNGQVTWYGRTTTSFNSAEIYFFDGTKVIRLTDNSYPDYSPSIHNGQVVWQGWDGHDYEIFLYNGEATFQLTDNDYFDGGPQIYNGQVVWHGYDGHDYEIFLYKDNQTLQLTDNEHNDTGPHIYNTEVVWNGSDGNDYEIFLYKDNQIIQLTNNGYTDYRPQVHNSQITWQGYDGHDYEIFLARTGLVKLLDGCEFSAGSEISSDPQKLVLQEGTVMQGVVADGVTRLLLKADVSGPCQMTVSIDNASNEKEDGTLRSIDGNYQGSTITVNSVSTSQGEKVFCIYQAPENFVRQAYELEDSVTSERNVTFKIKIEPFDNGPVQESTQECRILRPPVVLVHGLWSSEKMWDEFEVILENKIPGIHIHAVNYKNNNASRLEANSGVVYKAIIGTKKQLKPEQIAMVQADILGHSMGGMLGRIWAGRSEYKHKKNFNMGDINKLITLDSPHFGSFLADFVMDFINVLDPITKNQLLSKARQDGFPLDEGAIEDLQTMSAKIIYLNGIPIIPSGHSIVGDYEVNVDLSLLPFNIGELFTILKYYGFNTNFNIIPGTSDLVVSTKSQSAGLIWPASSIFNHHHCAATTEEVADKFIELLNSNSGDSSFEEGFPTAEWPEW